MDGYSEDIGQVTLAESIILVGGGTATLNCIVGAQTRLGFSEPGIEIHGVTISNAGSASDSLRLNEEWCYVRDCIFTGAPIINGQLFFQSGSSDSVAESCSFSGNPGAQIMSLASSGTFEDIWVRDCTFNAATATSSPHVDLRDTTLTRLRMVGTILQNGCEVRANDDFTGLIQVSSATDGSKVQTDDS